MPSSLIFVGLVVLWLLILVPAVARRRQEVARLSPAVLSGRVLERPMRHRLPEVNVTERHDDRDVVTVGELVERRHGVDDGVGPDERDGGLVRSDLAVHIDDEDEDLPDDRYGPEDDDGDWEPPAARYRPGRGGFDPDAAAAAADARYATRQRIVLVLLVLLLATVVLGLLVATIFWWAAGLTTVALAGYLTYLRRQVRIEESIRQRRSARLAGTHRSAAADDPDLDEWARRGRDAAAVHQTSAVHQSPADDEDTDGWETAEAGDLDTENDPDDDWTADDGEPSRVRGTGEPLGILPARRRTVDGADGTEHESSLPRLRSTPPPPIPAGTSIVDVDDDDELEAATGEAPQRRAAGE